ncbi:LysR family transcriptional regulator [Ferrimonas sp. YFM]|uniref:LysR family transcriptional regulator n=1 Tax=Ferrimonas sp. YFM TaxID=3028878 RepID=UPI00257463E7|nr:LysR family transcriptional regulator [Ferrimonas sp. YFM]BDY03484.1 LysR family transcriptional regulator [Ferrimonas sp. YFM]
MNTQQVLHFTLAARLGSLARAGAELGQSRSAVSMSISALEDQLGVSLFHRSGNAITLTQIGEALLEDCERLLAMEKRISRRCQLFHQTGEHRLCIARDDALPESLWQEILIEVKRTYPGLSLVVVLATPGELPQQVASGAVDLGFGVSLPSHPEVRRWSLGEIRLQLVSDGSHPLAAQKALTQEDLALNTQVTLASAGLSGVDTAHRLSSDFLGLSSFEQIRDMVQQGVGWAWLPSPLLSARLRRESLKVLDCQPNQQWQSYQVCCRQQASLGVVSESLCDRLSSSLAQYR